MFTGNFYLAFNDIHLIPMTLCFKLTFSKSLFILYFYISCVSEKFSTLALVHKTKKVILTPKLPDKPRKRINIVENIQDNKTIKKSKGYLKLFNQCLGNAVITQTHQSYSALPSA